MIVEMMRTLREVIMLLLYILLAICSKGLATHSRHTSSGESPGDMAGYCLSWRMAVESNNMMGWRTIPTQCLSHVEAYMMGGQYSRDIDLIIDQIHTYLATIPPVGILEGDDDLDAWILDIDDTCLSNLFYYQAKRFGYELETIPYYLFNDKFGTQKRPLWKILLAWIILDNRSKMSST